MERMSGGEMTMSARKIPEQENDVILASASPRRRELLKAVVPHFRIVPSGVDERLIQEVDPIRFAVAAAAAKAEDVSSRNPDSLVIAADTIVCLDDRIFGTPENPEDAGAMLRALSGRRHRVITGLAIVQKADGARLCGYEESFVTFKHLTPEALEAYIATGSPMDKAGAYAIQEVRDAFVESLEGNLDNVVGLPLKLVRTMLRQIQKIGKS
jgi:septum formation protein